MFEWTKSHGCNCHPIGEGCEKYHLNVGDIYSGIVQSKKCEKSGQVYWESSYMVCDKEVSGQSGGPCGRNENMAWIERRITDALNQLFSAHEDPRRKIVDSLWQDDEFGKLHQPEIK